MIKIEGTKTEGGALAGALEWTKGKLPYIYIYTYVYTHVCTSNRWREMKAFPYMLNSLLFSLMDSDRGFEIGMPKSPTGTNSEVVSLRSKTLTWFACFTLRSLRNRCDKGYDVWDDLRLREAGCSSLHHSWYQTYFTLPSCDQERVRKKISRHGNIL